MKRSARLAEVMAIGSVARRLAAIATVLVGTLGPGLLGNGHAAGRVESSLVKGLVSASYFSETCRHEAGLLGIEHTADARFLVAAFAQSMAAGAPDARAERRADLLDARSGSVSCDLPAVALINLLRLNGVAAELVLASPTANSAFTDRPDGVLVYVPAFDRYVDPAATDMRENATFDRNIRETAVRAHLIGPAPDADPALDRCGGICMSEYWPRHDPYRVRVKTEAIRGP
jgi:hypothetical protein